MPRLPRFTSCGPSAPPIPLLLLAAVVTSFFVPRALDYALGVLSLAAVARGLWAPRPAPEEPGGWRAEPALRVTLVGLLGLFGGGSIAWGWMTAGRATAGVVCLALLARAAATPREERDGGEAVGCGLLLGLYAATGWLGLFPPYLEEHLWPGTPAGQSARGVAGYLLLWLGGLVLVAWAARGRWRSAGPGPWWAAVAEAVGFGVWVGGALYCCGALPVGPTPVPVGAAES